MKLGPFIILKAKDHPAFLKTEKLARCLSENAIDDILAGRKHLHKNRGKKANQQPATSGQEGV